MKIANPENYLRLGGWLQNDRGWWHPPSCLASWPTHEAIQMALEDEAKGLRLTEEELKSYLAEAGIREIPLYIEQCK